VPDADIDALAALSGLGLPARVASGTWTLRNIISSGLGLSVGDGDGVEGDPTISLHTALQGMAGVTPANDTFLVGDGSTFVGESGSTARDSLGLGTLATQNASSVAITGGSVTGITDLAVSDGGTGAGDASGARSNLGLGTADSPTFTGIEVTGVTADFGGKLRHSGDTNTYIEFTDDRIDFWAGGLMIALFAEAATDEVVFNPTLSDLNLGWHSDTTSYFFQCDAGLDVVSVGGPPTTTRNNRLQVHGTDASGSAGPNIGLYTDSADYPGLQLRMYSLTDQSITFAGYHDGAWRSSVSAGTHAQITNLNGSLRFKVAAGVTQGSDITWTEAMRIDGSTGAVSGAGFGWDVNLVATAAQTVTNLQNQDSTELAFAVAVDEVWWVEAYLAVSGSSTAGDVAINLATTGTWDHASSEVLRYTGSGTLSPVAMTAAASTTMMIPSPGGTGGNGDSSVYPAILRACFRVTASGTVKVQFGLVSTGSGRTATLARGSRLLARRFAY